MLPFDSFNKAKNVKCGLSSRCKDCIREVAGRKINNKCIVDYVNELKSCSCCNEMKDFSEFSKSKAIKSGLCSICKSCYALKYTKCTGMKSCIVDYDRKVKSCSRCDKMLPFDRFGTNTNIKSGLNSMCKTCQSIHTGHVPRKDFYINYIFEVKECSKCFLIKSFSDFYKNKNTLIGLVPFCKECDSLRKSIYRKNNRDKINLYEKNKMLSDINFKIAVRLRVRLHSALTYSKSSRVGSAVRDLGCSISELKIHLEKQFYNRSDGTKMTWEQYGPKGFHIDHIKPLSSFDLSDRGQFLEACNWQNLQPLWCEDNLSKGAKYEEGEKG
jgi:hypothetical protein